MTIFEIKCRRLASFVKKRFELSPKEFRKTYTLENWVKRTETCRYDTCITISDSVGLKKIWLLRRYREGSMQQGNVRYLPMLIWNLYMSRFSLPGFPKIITFHLTRLPMKYI